MSTNPQSAIVLVIDRLGSGWLGPYGNTWIDTPAFNRLAAESLLFQHAMSDCPQLAPCYRSWWMGRHALANGEPSGSLAEAAANADLVTALLTDDEKVTNLPAADGFQQRLEILVGHAETADSVDETAFAQLLAAALDWLEQHAAQHPTRPFLLWIHAQGLQGPWDAPLSLRRQFADESDPTPPDFVSPPFKRFTADDDPDELLGVMHAYAGQVTSIDHSLSVFLDALDVLQLKTDTLLSVTAPRGFALGEHGVVGAIDDRLYGELLNVPLFLRSPHREQALRRSAALAQPDDLHRTLRDWLAGSTTGLLDLDLATEDSAAWQVASAAVGERRAVRTPAWFLTRSPSQSSELYVKPDDLWECNEVSDRCGFVVEELEQLLETMEANAESPRGHVDELSDALRFGVE